MRSSVLERSPQAETRDLCPLKCALTRHSSQLLFKSLHLEGTAPSGDSYQITTTTTGENSLSEGETAKTKSCSRMDEGEPWTKACDPAGELTCSPWGWSPDTQTSTRLGTCAGAGDS